MPKELNEELVITYSNDYNDFLDDLPNRLAPLISQLHELDYKLHHKLDKIDANSRKMATTKDNKKRRKYSKKAEKHAKRIKDIGQEKLVISSKIIEIVKSRGTYYIEYILYWIQAWSLREGQSKLLGKNEQAPFSRTRRTTFKNFASLSRKINIIDRRSSDP